MRWSPWVALIYLGIGIVVDVWLTLTKPDRVRAFGSILGASEAAPAATDAVQPVAVQ